MITMDTLQECEKFTGRRREICRGEAPGVPLTGHNSTNQYRQLWGLPPHPMTLPSKKDRVVEPRPRPVRQTIRERKAANKPKEQEKLGRYPGTNLGFLLKGFNVTVSMGCDCEQWIRWMNEIGPEGCLAKKHEIIERLSGKAADLVRKEGMQGVRTIVYTGWKMIWSGRWPTIEGLVDQAIQAAIDNR